MNESYLTVNGVTLQLFSAGDEHAPLIVLLHGFPENAFSWRHQIPVLAEAGFYVVAPNQRGYAQSDKPPHVADYNMDTLAADVAALIRALGYGDAIVIAHDWGGAIAYRFAMDYPQLLRRLVIMNAPHPALFIREIRHPRQLLKSWYMLWFQIPWLPETLFSLMPMRTANLFFRKAAVNKQAFSDDDIRRMVQAHTRPGAMHAMINWYRAAFRFPSRQPVRIITAPTLIVWAEDDVALGKALTYGMEAWFSSAFRLVYIPHCGHWVQNEAAAQVNALLLDFVAQK